MKIILTKEIGKQIQRILDQKDISQHRLSDLSGLRIEQINRIIKGKGNPTVNTLERIAAGLQVPVSKLFGKLGSQVNPLPEQCKHKELKPYLEFMHQSKNQKWLEFAYYVSTLDINKQEATTIIATYHTLKHSKII